MIEHPSVSRVRTAVDVEYEWIFFISIEVGWLLHPSLNFLAVKARIPDLFRLTEIQFRKHLVVDVRKLFPGSSGLIKPIKIANFCRSGNHQRKLCRIGRRAIT